MTEAIQKTTGTALAKPVEMPQGFENFDTTDLVLPRLKITQAISGVVTEGNAKAGQFYAALTGEVMDAPLEIVLLGMRKRRVMWDKKGETILCRSMDSKWKHDGSLKCQDCPHQQWGENNEPPKCSFTYDYPVLLRASEQPMIFSLSSTAMNAARKLNTMAQVAVDPKTKRRLAIYERSYIASLRQMEEGSKRWFVPDFKPGTQIEGGELDQVKIWFDMMSKINIKPAEDSEADGHNGTDTEGSPF